MATLTKLGSPENEETNDEECPFCGGDGVLFIPTSVVEGKVVGDRELKCSCRLKEREFDQHEH